MRGYSDTTTPVACRLSNEDIEIIDRRVKRNPKKWKNRSEYLRDKITYDISRSHGKKRG